MAPDGTYGTLQKSGELLEMQVGRQTSGAVEFDSPKMMLKSDCPETSRPCMQLVVSSETA
jgi:hypothetical protein